LAIVVCSVQVWCCAGTRQLENRQDFLFTHDEEFLAVELDLLAGVLPEQDRVAGLDVQVDAASVVLDLAGADGDDLALLRLLLGGVRNDDSADLLFALVDALDEDPVVERSGFHRCHPH